MHPIPDRNARRPLAAGFRRWFAALGLIAPLLAGALVAACGGGGGMATAQASATYAAGPIRGFGSVIVNGVRFDDSMAALSDDDGHTLAAGTLQLGMEAEVEAGEVDASAKARASSIRIHSDVVGAVQAIDLGAGTVTVIDQVVATDAQTVFDSNLANGLADLASGDVIKVYGAFDGVTQTIKATRIERDADATQFKLRGTVTALDATLKQLSIGSAVIDYSAASGVPANLAVGSIVVARLKLAPVAGVWIATSLGFGRREIHDHDEAHLEGVISDFTDLTHFSIDGTPVDATNASFPDGQAGVVLGATVEAEGTITNGVLVARSVSLESAHEGHGHDIELHGAVTGLDTTLQTFTLRNTLVSYAGPVTYRGGDAGRLVEGVHVEVQGDLAADGKTVNATLIMFGGD